MLQQGMQGYGRTQGYGRERGREWGGRSAAPRRLRPPGLGYPGRTHPGRTRPSGRGSLRALPRAEGSSRRRCPARFRSAASPAIRPLIKTPGLVGRAGRGSGACLPALPRGSAGLQVRARTPAVSHFGDLKT